MCVNKMHTLRFSQKNNRKSKINTDMAAKCFVNMMYLRKGQNHYVRIVSLVKQVISLLCNTCTKISFEERNIIQNFRFEPGTVRKRSLQICILYFAFARMISSSHRESSSSCKNTHMICFDITRTFTCRLIVYSDARGNRAKLHKRIVPLIQRIKCVY